MGILLNHLVEEFGPGPWFTNPSGGWPPLSERLASLFPAVGSIAWAGVVFLGWLGDAGPGVFIFAAGATLVWSTLEARRFSAGDFYKRRLWRIYPLYIAMHFVILGLALFVPGNDLTLANRQTLASLLGLRVTPALFFYISPSWWFVWLIVQLYALFPLLLAAQRRLGLTWFLAACCLLTFACRAVGALGIVPGDWLYSWMTGIFCGTRLAEFAAGMTLAAAIGSGAWRETPSPTMIFLASLASYVAGFGCSLFLPTTIVSNLLVTLGLSGLFYSAWRLLAARATVLAGMVAWLGAASYGIYLFHQPPLEWTAALANDGRAPWLLAVACLTAAVPIGWCLERAVGALPDRFGAVAASPLGPALAALVALSALAALLVVEPILWSDQKHRALALLVGAAVAWLIGHLVYSKRRSVAEGLYAWAIWAGLLQLFVLPPRSGPVAVAVGGAFALAVLVAAAVSRSRVVGWSLSPLIAVCALAPVEYGLRQFAPLETNRWGELPALEEHPTRVYTLKPNLDLQLRYNNYDYVVRTNSAGMTGPLVPIDRTDPQALRVLVIGDAFAMPEGLPYEQSFVAGVQARLSRALAPRPVEIIDAAVTGYGPNEEFATLAELCPRYKPDIVVLEFFVNDFEEAKIDRESRLRSIGFVRASPSRVDDLFGQSQIVARIELAHAAIKQWLTGAPAPWRFSKSLVRFYRTDEAGSVDDEGRQLVAARLRQMRDVADTCGAKFLVAYVPAAVQVEPADRIAYYPWTEDLAQAPYDRELPWRALSQLTSGLGITAIDLAPALTKRAEPVYFADAWHWNAAGHQIAAERLSEALIESTVSETKD